MRRLFNNFFSVIFSLIKFLIIKLFHWRGFSFSLVERFSPDVVTEFNKGSVVQLGKMVRVHSGCKIKVRSGANLHIGSNVKINYNCIIVCHDKIDIGEGTEFGPSVYIYDHDHDYKSGFSADSNKENYFSAPIKIGKNCWIGTQTVILRGTEIGDNCVVGAGCILSGKYEENSLIVQKRETTVINANETE